MMLSLLCGCTQTLSEGWKLETFTYSDGTARENFAQLTFSPSDEYEVWLKIADMNLDNSVVDFAAGYSSTISYKKNSVTVTNEVLSATGGWVRLQTNVSSSYAYIEIGTKYAMTIKEIVVCATKDGEIYPCTLHKSGYRISQSNSSNRHEFTEEELAEMKNGPQKLCDEQDSTGFDRAAVLAAFNEATSASDSTSASNS